MFMDLMNYLLRQRIIFLSGYVNDKLATQVVGSLLALEAMDEDEDIRLYINSPGEWRRTRGVWGGEERGGGRREGEDIRLYINSPGV
jgi:ATP-dependent protease ClpP protease subunit